MKENPRSSDFPVGGMTFPTPPVAPGPPLGAPPPGTPVPQEVPGIPPELLAWGQGLAEKLTTLNVRLQELLEIGQEQRQILFNIDVSTKALVLLARDLQGA